MYLGADEGAANIMLIDADEDEDDEEEEEVLEGRTEALELL